jgi:hypothetical protein
MLEGSKDSVHTRTYLSSMPLKAMAMMLPAAVMILPVLACTRKSAVSCEQKENAAARSASYGKPSTVVLLA